MKRGFTLIETLFAILILTLAIAAPLSIAARGLNAALVAKDQTTAFYLAQDAVEHIRYLRDSACLAAAAAHQSPCPANAWLSTLASCTSMSGTAACTVNTVDDTVTSCPGGVCPVFWYYPSGGYYNYASLGAPSIFTRTIQITTPVGSGAGSNSSEALVTATVNWLDVGGVARSVKVQEDMLNWQ